MLRTCISHRSPFSPSDFVASPPNGVAKPSRRQKGWLQWCLDLYCTDQSLQLTQQDKQSLKEQCPCNAARSSFPLDEHLQESMPNYCRLLPHSVNLEFLKTGRQLQRSNQHLCQRPLSRSDQIFVQVRHALLGRLESSYQRQSLAWQRSRCQFLVLHFHS